MAFLVGEAGEPAVDLDGQSEVYIFFVVEMQSGVIWDFGLVIRCRLCRCWGRRLRAVLPAWRLIPLSRLARIYALLMKNAEVPIETWLKGAKKWSEIIREKGVFSGLEQVEETVAKEQRRLQVGEAIEQVPTAAEFIDPGSEPVEDILKKPEIVRSIAGAHDPALALSNFIKVMVAGTLPKLHHVLQQTEAYELLPAHQQLHACILKAALQNWNHLVKNLSTHFTDWDLALAFRAINGFAGDVMDLLPKASRSAMDEAKHRHMSMKDA
ncbi:hypothetical protein BJ878DRAFT_481125 [Calycina marina]|uniref:Uncharacterized protein n=1 Tax=Calycina marina TaxID=1763456 RepID=A0A9P8CDU3_9HELO|nr:hypothetical protein BJ878DRAFT_481125 [Calycina marina]